MWQVDYTDIYTVDPDNNISFPATLISFGSSSRASSSQYNMTFYFKKGEIFAK